MTTWFARIFGRAGPQFSAAGPADAAGIAELHAQCFHRGWSEEEVHELLRDRAVTAERVSLGGQLAGFVLSRRAAEEAEILSIAVTAPHRGRGLAHALLDRHLRGLAGRGTRAVFLEVDEGNTAAIRLYGRAGFRQVGRRPNYYPQPGVKPATALILRRDLV